MRIPGSLPRSKPNRIHTLNLSNGKIQLKFGAKVNTEHLCIVWIVMELSMVWCFVPLRNRLANIYPIFTYIFSVKRQTSTTLNLLGIHTHFSTLDWKCNFSLCTKWQKSNNNFLLFPIFSPLPFTNTHTHTRHISLVCLIVCFVLIVQTLIHHKIGLVR